MTVRTDPCDSLMDRVLRDVFLGVAVKAEPARFRNEQERERRAVGVMADLTSAGDERTVDILLIQLERVTVQTEFFDRHDQGVCRPLMAAIAQFGRKRTVFPVCRP